MIEASIARGQAALSTCDKDIHSAQSLILGQERIRGFNGRLIGSLPLKVVALCLKSNLRAGKCLASLNFHGHASACLHTAN